MVDENKQLASRIDGEIQSGQEQVNSFREELTDANKRLEEHVKYKTDGPDMTNGREPSKKPSSSESQDILDKLFFAGDGENRDGENGDVKKTASTNPFTDGLVSNKATNKLDFFADSKSIDFFSSKLSESANFFGGGFSEGSKREESASDKCENRGKKSECCLDGIGSKLFGAGESGGETKPEDFVLTSNVKLNFLTRSPDDNAGAGKSTGAVPKRRSRSNSSSSVKSGEVNDGDAEKAENEVENFVRPTSPISGTTKNGW